ncbi:MAG: N-acetylmuramoyl-L-alanine amidase [Negativibacillus sp.]
MAEEKSRRVFIGVGHGGSDPGAVKYIKEADANLQMALGLKSELERHGVTVGISRLKDEDDPLTEEIKEANAFAPDVAVECHNNASGSTNGADGFEVYHQTNGYAAQSRRLAQCIEARVVASGQQSRGVKTRLNGSGTDYFGWCRQVKAPAVLCEGFFVDNLVDSSDYNTAAKQQAFGRVYAWGVLDYLGIAVQPQDSGWYTVQVGAFVSAQNAQRLADQLKERGYFVQLHHGSLVRVCVGRFGTQAEARQTAQDLSKKGFGGLVKVCG